MTETSSAILRLYGMPQDALEDLCDTLITEQPYADLFGEEQQAFHDWVFEHAHHYIDGDRIDWIGAFYDWNEE